MLQSCNQSWVLILESWSRSWNKVLIQDHIQIWRHFRRIIFFLRVYVMSKLLFDKVFSAPATLASVSVASAAVVCW